MRRKRPTNCLDCDVLLSKDNIAKSIGIRIRIMPRCKSCHSIYQRKIRIERGYMQRSVAVNRLKKFGITQEMYDALSTIQLNGCAICKQSNFPNQLHVDHNHETNEVRGLLCGKCNTALGLLREDEDIIWNMLEYLKRTTWKKAS